MRVDVEMRLFREYFDLVASGRKTVEVRVCDEKRRGLTAGDRIRFRCNADEALVRVVRVARYSSFAELLDTEDTGKVNPTLSREEQLTGMRRIYGPEQESLGCLAIEVALVK